MAEPTEKMDSVCLTEEEAIIHELAQLYSVNDEPEQQREMEGKPKEKKWRPKPVDTQIRAIKHNLDLIRAENCLLKTDLDSLYERALVFTQQTESIVQQ